MVALMAAAKIAVDVKSDTVQLPFAVHYATQSTLGADRIAAIAGAMCHVADGSAFVADLGTAATFDLVTGLGRQPVYQGGNISAGVQMRLNALHDHTSALPKISADAVPDGLWGDSTCEALIGGAVHGIIAELQYYRSKAPAPCTTVLTGGGSSYLAHNGLLDFEYIHDPLLVLRGLNHIISYNENR